MTISDSTRQVAIAALEKRREIALFLLQDSGNPAYQDRIDAIDATIAELQQAAEMEVVPAGTKINGELDEELEFADDGTLLIATNPGTGMVFQLPTGWLMIRPKEE